MLMMMNGKKKKKKIRKRKTEQAGVRHKYGCLNCGKVYP